MNLCQKTGDSVTGLVVPRIATDNVFDCRSKRRSFRTEKPVDCEGFQKTVSAEEPNHVSLLKRRIANVAEIFDRNDESLPRCNENDLLGGLDFDGQRVHND